MLAELERHPHARAVLGPALGDPLRPSHAYLFHGPGGAGKRAAARALAAELLADGAGDPDSARLRVAHGLWKSRLTRIRSVNSARSSRTGGRMNTRVISGGPVIVRAPVRAGRRVPRTRDPRRH